MVFQEREHVETLAALLDSSTHPHVHSEIWNIKITVFFAAV
jgi:hypothetical protein